MTKQQKRGFAAMPEDKQRKVAAKGGAGVAREQRSFFQNRELAREAGRKGGKSVAAAKRSFSQDRELAAAAGRKGGKSTKVRVQKNDTK